VSDLYTQVRPYVHKILVVIEPLLIDEDYYARVEGREIISNLAKAAGLATMIATMRPDIDNLDEYVRNTTARAFAVVASALGIPALLPFLKAVCQSRKSWQARHTGIKIVQQIAILMGCAVLPHLKHLVEIVEHGLIDEQQKVRTITALSLAALAEAAHPYGIESFDSVLRPLWKGIRQHRGKGLAAFLKAIGFIIPLMDASYANYYTREVRAMPITIPVVQAHCRYHIVDTTLYTLLKPSIAFSPSSNHRLFISLLGHGDPYSRVPIARRRDEKDRAEGGKAMCGNRWGRAVLCQRRGAAGILQELLGATNGIRPVRIVQPPLFGVV
jgi:hypothetical protein